MKRIKILNKRIEQYFQKKHDQELITKLKTIKPTINIKCPESYIFFKTQFNSYKTEPRKIEQKLPVVNNKKRKKIKTKLIIKARNRKENLPLNLLSNSSNNYNNKNNNILKHLLGGKSIHENSKILDDNFNLSKRIKEKSSYYSLSQWKKDFKKSRVYKKISCEYPSINFVGKTKRKIKTKNQEMSPTKFINAFSDVKFIPISSFSSGNKRSSSNSRDKDKDKNRTLNKIRRNKFNKLFEENNKIIFDKQLKNMKKIFNHDST